jgi:hypothetical protein
VAYDVITARISRRDSDNPESARDQQTGREDASPSRSLRLADPEDKLLECDLNVVISKELSE